MFFLLLADVGPVPWLASFRDAPLRVEHCSGRNPRRSALATY
jgi:hypothetical protein